MLYLVNLKYTYDCSSLLLSNLKRVEEKLKLSTTKFQYNWHSLIFLTLAKTRETRTELLTVLVSLKIFFGAGVGSACETICTRWSGQIWGIINNRGVSWILLIFCYRNLKFFFDEMMKILIKSYSIRRPWWGDLLQLLFRNLFWRSRSLFQSFTFFLDYFLETSNLIWRYKVQLDINGFEWDKVIRIIYGFE